MNRQKVIPVGLLIILTMLGIVISQQLPQYTYQFIFIAAVIVAAIIIRNLIRTSRKEKKEPKPDNKEEK